uniref:nucleoside-diphosphate kinase n=1 Tax=Scleropages formosus TaxID=113540 RepID=A0A8C9RHZ8_SCLFO
MSLRPHGTPVPAALPLCVTFPSASVPCVQYTVGVPKQCWIVCISFIPAPALELMKSAALRTRVSSSVARLSFSEGGVTCARPHRSWHVPTLYPRFYRGLREAVMICLVLTIFAHIFHAAWVGLNEQTFVAVKPDGVHRRLVGEIIRRFERKGFRLAGMKLLQPSDTLLKEHYWELRDKPFFGRLIRYMSSGPVVAMVWQGLDVVKTARRMLGETNPADSLPGTIRGDFCVEVARYGLTFPPDVVRARVCARASMMCPTVSPQERGAWQRLCAERPEGDLPVVSAARARVLGGQQPALDL